MKHIENLTKEQQQFLINKATDAYKNAYSPYSKFKVGAAVLTVSGNIYTGCNVENASYGLTICAERNAIFAAINGEGAKMKILAIVIMNDKHLECSPCGACRQVISEFSMSSPRESIVIYVRKNNLIKGSINSLLPSGFKFKK